MEMIVPILERMRRHYLRKVDIQRMKIRKAIRDGGDLRIEVEKLDNLLTKLFKYMK